MKTLPDKWRYVKIGDLCSLINGKAFKPSDWTNDGFPIIRIQNLNNSKAKYNHFSGEIQSKFIIENGELLFAWSGTPGTSFGAHIWQGKTAVLNQHIFRVIFNEFFINKSFFKIAINFKLQELIDKAHGGVGLRHVTKGKFEKTEIALPPFKEQKRIVAKIEALQTRSDRVKEQLEEIKPLLDRFRQSVLAAAFRGDLTKNWREQNPDVEPAEVLLELDIDNKKWVKQKSQDCCYKVQNGSTPKGKPFSDIGDIPFLKVYNIVGQKIDFDYKPQFISQEIHKQKLKRSITYPNDVLMNIVGPPLQKVALVTDQFSEWNINQAIVLFRPKEYLNSKYLYYFLYEGDFVRKIIFETKGIVGQVNISLTQCRNCIVRIPPLEEQKEIVRRIESLFKVADNIEREYQQAETDLETLNQSILAKAFRGELVPQDPNDEPASVLLERIREEKAAAKKSSKKKKKTEQLKLNL